MSRIGRKPIKVPEKVKISTRERIVVVEGPLGKLEAILPEGVTVRVEAGVANVVAPKATRGNRGFQGLMRALLANMVHGVVKGYEKQLEINGVGYKAELKGQDVIVSAGYSHLVKLRIPKGLKVAVDKTQTKVSVTGIDKQLVGQFAAQFRGVKVPEPYKGKGIRYANETIRRKVGKAGAK
jgi:large subunit ribosomal protein L6